MSPALHIFPFVSFGGGHYLLPISNKDATIAQNKHRYQSPISSFLWYAAMCMAQTIIQ
jgi:hypothetical protein